MRLLSLLNTAVLTVLRWPPLSTGTSWPTTPSHIFAVPSWLAVRMRFPSGLNSARGTSLPFPLMTKTGWPVRFSSSLHETHAPTAHELEVLRDMHARTERAHAAPAVSE